MSTLITIIGPTASGKTRLAALLASRVDGEILSGDSRQVYRDMDLGTGKDLADYIVDGKTIPYHLIDIVDAGYKYNVYEYQRDFTAAFNDIISRGKTPILCGGSGMYIEAVLKGFRLIQVPSNPALRRWCDTLSDQEITTELRKYKRLHNTTDIDTRRRAVRALEIETYYAANPLVELAYPQIEPVIIGVSIDREVRRQRIDTRLETRINEGMVEEVKGLLARGVPAETLVYYGLEYKFLARYVTGQISYDECQDQLNIAIHQFAKRQMTWFRGMERRGMLIHWIDGQQPVEQRVEDCLSIIHSPGN